ncbi:MAG: leucine-rich repeat domain-containing protein [Clostridia bacterium]|nr:leucine-rich repeat domain-containing protein [Clostridia bacterium]
MKFKRLLSMICAISIIMSVSVVSGAMTDDTTAVGFNDEEAVVILGEDAGTGEENSAVDASVFDDLSADAIDLVYSRLNNFLGDFWDSETMTLGDIIEGYVAIVDEETGIKLDVDYFTQRFEQNYDLEGREISTSFLDELLGATIDNVTTTYGQDAVETLYNVIKNTNIVNLFAKIYVKEPELAATGQCGDNVYWTFDKETGALTISGEGAMWSDCFINEESIKSVTIESGVTEIGFDAFRSCTNLTSIVIPNSVTSINGSAFYGCTSLTSVIIPDSVTYIAYRAFYDCDITGDLVIPSSVETIGYQAFEKNRNIETLTISEGVETIGENAFALCESLKIVNIPLSIKSLYYGAFYGCGEITDVFFPGKEIRWNNLGGTEYFGLDMNKVIVHFANKAPSGQCGDNVYWTFDDETGTLTISGEGDMWDFYEEYEPGWDDETGDSCWLNPNGTIVGGYSVKSIVIESGVTSIGDMAFYSGSFTSVEIPDTVTSIGYSAFEHCGKLTSVEIPDSVVNIGWDAFYNCSGLRSVTIGNSVTSIGGGAFKRCSSLTSIEIPDTVTSIGNGTFAYCKSLTSIEFPDTVTSIGNGMFAYCTSLTSVEIPDSVTSIGDWAFEDCTSLTSIVIPNGVTSIGKYAFYQCSSLASIEISDNVTSIGNYAFYRCTGLTNIKADKNNENYCSDEFGVLYNKGKTELIQYPVGNTRTSFTIPDSVTGIGNGVFYSCISLVSIEIPEGVTSIGYDAFYNCTSLTSIEIPDSVTSIGDLAFEDCTRLTSVTIGSGVTSIGYSAFSRCESLTSVTIPDSVTSIGNFAFEDCNNMCILCNKGSFAHQYAIENGIPFEFIKTVRSVSIPDMTIKYRSSAYISVLLDADVGAEYAISFSSSNPRFISVDNTGKVTSNRVFGFNPGSAVITCTVTDSYGNTFTCTSTVKARFTLIQLIIKILLGGGVWY